ncbi:MAG TPA: hypothetical protein VK483_02765 [Chitinophagaceae bacterium]|nr:hypothetical protein [Chitinophagaceae bacterium]
MEVHAHSHTERKKWTHYFWEFLMLFLAVFCGFLAENQREHLVEAHRAKEYAKGLLSDIRLDTGELRRGVNTTKFTISSIDSIVSISKNLSHTNIVPGTFYYFSKFMSYSFRIDWSKSTIDQLIQSGNLRYFRNKELVSMINYYYSLQGLIAAQNQIDAGHRDKTMELRNSILLSRYYSLFVARDLDFTGQLMPSEHNDSLSSRQLPLQENADKQIDKYLNYLIDRKSRLTNMVRVYYSDANEVALNIIKTLISEYNLK